MAFSFGGGDEAMFERDLGGGNSLGNVFQGQGQAGAADFSYQPEHQPQGQPQRARANSGASNASRAGGDPNAVLHHNSVELQK